MGKELKRSLVAAMTGRKPKPTKGVCKCPDEPGGLDQRKISRILGSTMTCLKCGKRKV